MTTLACYLFITPFAPLAGLKRGTNLFDFLLRFSPCVSKRFAALNLYIFARSREQRHRGQSESACFCATPASTLGVLFCRLSSSAVLVSTRYCALFDPSSDFLSRYDSTYARAASTHLRTAPFFLALLSAPIEHYTWLILARRPAVGAPCANPCGLAPVSADPALGLPSLSRTTRTVPYEASTKRTTPWISKCLDGIRNRDCSSSLRSRNSRSLRTAFTTLPGWPHPPPASGREPHANWLYD